MPLSPILLPGLNLSPSAPSPDFRPTASPANLQLRARLLQTVRRFFDDRGFLEVETPSLSVDTVVELHIDPISVTLPDDVRRPSVGRTLWLQTSPEFHMKRLLATGDYPAIYQITRAFRAAERGALHNPEFTIVEWYRVGDDYDAGMQLLSDLCEATLHRGPAERLSYREAFQRFANIDPIEPPASSIQHPASRDENLNLLLATKIEPQLGRARPTILYDYPASQAALARVAKDAEDHDVAQRFELYVDGIELANGYYELLDAAELHARSAQNNALRAAYGRPTLPEENKLLAAMEHGLPVCTGVALGFDRLVMVAAGAKSIDEVIAFPLERT
jgi:lysyl-tRNA synthetase class 2